MSFTSGFVAVVGRPNVGKSTLINALAGEKVMITSNKPQTTRNAIKAIVTEEDSQIIFLDTPGIHTPKTKLGNFMVKEAYQSLEDVDIVVFLIDADEKKGLSDEILSTVIKSKVPVILVINKVDTVQKDTVLPLIDYYSKKAEFVSCVPISALQGVGVDIVSREIKKLLPEGPEFFPKDILTDQSERFIVCETIREKILELIQDEIPHGTAVEVISFKEREGQTLLEISANIYCEKDSHKSILIGKNGAMLKKIGSRARHALESFFGVKVFLEVWVKVKEDWRNSDYMLKSFGYKKIH